MTRWLKSSCKPERIALQRCGVVVGDDRDVDDGADAELAPEILPTKKTLSRPSRVPYQEAVRTEGGQDGPKTLLPYVEGKQISS
jgi:hypothetical protein